MSHPGVIIKNRRMMSEDEVGSPCPPILAGTHPALRLDPSRRRLCRALQMNMKRLTEFFVMLAAACMIAGAYGAMHSQVSFTISPVYWYLNYFAWQLPESLHNRLGVALVGFFTTWWMGLVIGLPILLAGQFLLERDEYVEKSFHAFGVAGATAVLFGFAGLSMAYFATDNDVVHVQEMNDYGYDGGFVGVFIGLIYLKSVRYWRWSHRCKVSMT